MPLSPATSPSSAHALASDTPCYTGFAADLHCHGFNARDLPIEGFIRCFFRGYRGKRGERFPWAVRALLSRPVKAFVAAVSVGVDTAAAELGRLNGGKAVTPPVELADLPAAPDKDALLREAVLDIPADASHLKYDAVDDDETRVARYLQEQAVNDEELREWIKEWIDEPSAELPPSSLKMDDPFDKLRRLVARAFNWAVGLFKSLRAFLKALRRSRHDNLQEMATLSRPVTLFTPALVDFDQWANGDAADSSMASQVELQEALAIRAYAGKIVARSISVHGFVGFNPLQEIKGVAAYVDPKHLTADPPSWTDLDELPRNARSFDVVRDAIEERGFVGVKLYLNCGFWPTGNALRGRADGHAIDGALDRLYDWCAVNGVPLLVHTGESNAFAQDFRACSHPDGWRPVLARHKKLRICLAHFALHAPVDVNEGGDPWIHAAARLALDEAGRVFFDISNTDTLDDDERKALTGALTGENASLQSQLFYGSDYFMCELNHEPSTGYFDRAEKDLCHRLDLEPGFCRSFFADAALRFLGLRDEHGQPATGGNRERLLRWYDTKAKAEPPEFLRARPE